jgi:hypothetical protein
MSPTGWLILGIVFIALALFTYECAQVRSRKWRP